jgi:hypothetical protein
VLCLELILFLWCWRLNSVPCRCEAGTLPRVCILRPLLFWDRVSLGSPGWPCIRDLPASASWVLGLQTCTIMPGFKAPHTLEAVMWWFPNRANSDYDLSLHIFPFATLTFLCLFLILFYLFIYCETRVYTQGFVLAKQVLYFYSHTSLFYFWIRIH